MDTSVMNEIVDVVVWLLPFLIPLAIIQLGLMITALVHALRHKTYKTGNRTLWILVILLVNIIGPVLYFIIGKGEE
ncbi:MAG: PLD nuclease N-terminal domain-containing protein [Lachnospiraceae bacterium]|jgi:hypothetical protein|nr:PLD nuclease N-terminal domain-containing protein [Lachnospiraceae bacterium]